MSPKTQRGEPGQIKETFPFVYHDFEFSNQTEKFILKRSLGFLEMLVPRHTNDSVETLNGKLLKAVLGTSDGGKNRLFPQLMVNPEN